MGSFPSLKERDSQKEIMIYAYASDTCDKWQFCWGFRGIFRENGLRHVRQIFECNLSMYRVMGLIL
jgi:hypothetical protein